MRTEKNQLHRIRGMLVLFIVLLILSGITAFPIETQLHFLTNHISGLPEFTRKWIVSISNGVTATNKAYPFISYGTDWLAFAHIVIGVFFIGPVIDPVKNIFTLKAGMIACLSVFPLAFIAGPIRGIPFWWQLIDCSFGFFGFLLLWKCYKMIRQFEKRLQPIKEAIPIN